MITIHLRIKEHENRERIFAIFEYDVNLNKIFRSIKDAKWSNTNKGWHFPLKKESVEQIISHTNKIAIVDRAELKDQLVKRKQSKEDVRLANINAETKDAIRVFKQ